MATNIQQITNSIVPLQRGNGIPTHISQKNSLFVDLDNATFYVNKNGVASWASLLDSTSVITGSTSGDTYITGVTYSNNNLTLYRNDGINLSTSIDVFSGLTINGTLSATTISATTYYGDGSNLVGVSGGFTGWTYGTGFNSIKRVGYIGTSATGLVSFAEGDDCHATGDYSHAEGVSSVAAGYASHAEGRSSSANGSYSHAQGYGTVASGDFSHAGGYTSNALGYGSFAMGEGSVVHGMYGFAMGYNNIVVADRSAILGGRNITATTEDTVYVPLLNIQSGSTDNSLTNLLVSDLNGNIKYRTVSSILSGVSVTDIFTTGGTYSNGTAIFTNSTGGTFSVTGFTTGSTSAVITGGTKNDSTKQYTFTNSTGGTFTVNGLIDINTTGATLNDSSKQYTFTNNTGGTFNVGAFTDVRVTGGTYSNGTTTLVNNTGGTINISGYYTGATDVYVTGGTANNSTKVYTFTNSTGGTFTVTGLIDTAITGGTYSNGVTTLTNNTGGTITISGLYTGATYPGTGDRMVEAASGGTVSASKEIVDLFVTDSTLIIALQTSANWLGSPSVYISSSSGATGGYQGQFFLGGLGGIPYLFFCKADQVWVRISLTDITLLQEGGTGANLSGTTASGIITMNATQTALTNTGFLINQSVQTTNSPTFAAMTLNGQLNSSEIIVGGQLNFTESTATQLSASSNNYTLGTFSSNRISSVSAVTITGLVLGTVRSGRFVYITNVGSFPITFTNEDALSTAANRITSSTGFNILLDAGQTIAFKYDNTTSRWRDASMSKGALFNPRTITKAASFTVGAAENNVIYNVTTGTNVITVTYPTAINGFIFYVKKSDSATGVIITSTASITITRQNQFVEFAYNGSTWDYAVLDEGYIPTNSVMANLSGIADYASEIATVDIHDITQKAYNYDQNGFSKDWLSGVFFRQFRPSSVTGTTKSSIISTGATDYIGASTTPLRVSAFSMVKGKTLVLEMDGKYTSTNVADTLLVEIKIGGVTLTSSSPFTVGTVYTDNYFKIRYTIQITDTGVLGGVLGLGTLQVISSTYVTTHFPLVNTYTAQTLDTTIDNDIVVNIQHSAAGGSMTNCMTTLERKA